MPDGKQAFVASAIGELTIMVTFTDIMLTLDLSIPNLPAFVLRVPFEHVEGGKQQMFAEMIAMVQAEFIAYLTAAKIPQELVDQTYASMEKAIDASAIQDSRMEKMGEGEDPLLDVIAELEPTDVFEVKFQLPKGLSHAIHQKIVTGSFNKEAWLQPVEKIEHGAGAKLPKNFQTNHNPTTLKQNYPSVRNLVRKFKPQQNKALTGPIFVMVYDMQGRPVGVRSIKGPGWAWAKKGSDEQAEAAPAPPGALPSPRDLAMQGLEFRMWLRQNVDQRATMKQGPSGTVYVFFRGPVSLMDKKVRISDHAMTTNRDPRKMVNTLPDLSVDPTSGSTLEQAKDWSKTASLFERRPKLAALLTPVAEFDLP